MSLHRPMLRMIQRENDDALIQVCLSAAKARVTSTIDFVRSLRAEHLQSFWYSASQYNFALLGTFLCLLQHAPVADVPWCKEKLEEYKWILRLSSKSADFLDRAISTLTLSTAMMTPTEARRTLIASGAHDADDSDDDDETNAAGEDGSQLSPTAANASQLDQSWFDFGSPLARFDLNEAMGVDPNFMYADSSGTPLRYVDGGNAPSERR